MLFHISCRLLIRPRRSKAIARLKPSRNWKTAGRRFGFAAYYCRRWITNAPRAVLCVAFAFYEPAGPRLNSTLREFDSSVRLDLDFNLARSRFHAFLFALPTAESFVAFFASQCAPRPILPSPTAKKPRFAARLAAVGRYFFVARSGKIQLPLQLFLNTHGARGAHAQVDADWDIEFHLLLVVAKASGIWTEVKSSVFCSCYNFQLQAVGINH